LVLTDTNGNTQTINTKLDANLTWSLSNTDVSGLDLSSDLTVSSATIQTEQEVATQEHFTTSIINSSGDKDILDMTFTKAVPQGTSGTTWNADVKILSYYEDYDSSKTYDSSLYSVNTSTNKVYQIVDDKTGTLTFGDTGELTSNTLPTLNNNGTALTLNLGTVGSYNGLISSK